MTASNSFLDRRLRELRESEPSVPLAYDELERTARDHIPGRHHDYVAGAAGTEGTLGENRDAFHRYRVVTRVLRDVSERDLSVRLFGRELPAPLLLAPIGSQSKYDDEGELATARGAAELGVPFVVGTMSSYTLEAVAEEAGRSPCLFQLYWLQDWDVTASLVRRAERADYEAIIVTVDSQLPKWRQRYLRNIHADARNPPKANLLSDPVAEEKYGGADDLAAAVRSDSAFDKETSLTWDALDFLGEQTDLPIVLKGILTPEDAREAVDRGVDGIVVSNHGGRQIDGGLAAMDALPDVLAAVDGRIPVLLDSGIRGGSDVFKAVALGADAVLFGRPYIYGLSIAGQRGVYETVGNCLAELDSVLGLSGRPSIDEVDRSALVERPRR